MRNELIKIANSMVEGQAGYLFKLRELVVDLDLTAEASKEDIPLFLALYLSKKLTSDVWENLATDASFNFSEDTLSPFTISFGEMLSEILNKRTSELTTFNKLGETAKCLYGFFARISEDPSLILTKGGQHGSSKF